MKSIIQLIESRPCDTTSSDVELNAILYAAEKHKNQHRKCASKVPYINHPIAVMCLLQRADVTVPEERAAAVLHDTVEDTDATLGEIEMRFGKQVADIVAEVTDDKSLSKIDRKKAQIERMKTASPAARCIKIADKISNVLDTTLETPTSWTLLDIQGYAVWSAEVVKASTDENDHCNGWLVDTFNNLLSTSTVKADDGTLVPLLPKDCKACLEQYYASIAKPQ